MTALIVPNTIRPLTQAARYCRNGKAPDATFESEMKLLADQVAAFRGKEVFRSGGSLASMGTSAAPNGSARARWRFQFKTGPFAKYIGARVIMAKTPASLKGAYDSYVGLSLFNLANVLQGTDIVHWSQVSAGNPPASDYPDNFVVANLRIPVTPNTDYWGFAADGNRGRLLSICAFEEMLPPDTANGFVSPVSVVSGGPIFVADRADISALIYKAWLQTPAHTFNWSTDLDADARVAVAVTADRNVVDNTSTTVTAATPGFTIDLTNKATLSSGGLVNMVIAAYATATGTSGSWGIRLKNSAGTVITSLTTGWTGAAGWSKQAFQLPVGLAKYDLQLFVSGAGGGTFTLYAVSVYEQG